MYDMETDLMTFEVFTPLINKPVTQAITINVLFLHISLQLYLSIVQSDFY